MLCNLLYIQALLFTISAYFFTTPEHLGGQEGVRATLTVEQPELGAQESGNQKTGWTTITFRVSRQGAGLIRVSSWAVATLGPVMGGKAVAFLKGEREPGKRGAAKLHYSSRGKHRTILQGGRTVGFGICQSKVIFHLAAQGGLFLPLAPPGERKDHATAFVQHLRQAWATCIRFSSFFFCCLSSS